MTQAIERTEAKYQQIAADLSCELAASALERDLRAGAPIEEIQRLRETGSLPLVVPQQYGGAEPR